NHFVEVPREQFDALIRQGKLTGLPTPAQSPLANDIQSRLRKAGDKDLEAANRRLAVVAAYLVRAPQAEAVPSRTARDWVRRYKHAEQIYGRGWLGLLSRSADKGNRQRKLPPATLA